jgi:hypothetical protein
MKVYKIELMVIDFDEVGEDIPVCIEEARYPNHCITPKVVSINSREIGEWHDDHPLNKKDLWRAHLDHLFSEKPNNQC